VRSGDLPQHEEKAFPVTARVQAGAAALQPIAPGHAVRIFTGGVIPDGADAVIIQENTGVDGDCLTITEAAVPGRHIRPAGVDFREGDVLLGLASNGLHTNGYSLARKLLFAVARYQPETYVNELKNKVGAELMRTHKSYWPLIKRLADADCVTAMAHITGGGITENLPRMLPRGTAAAIQLGSWPVLPVFEHLRELGNIPQDEMLRVFNMGIGLVLVVPPKKFKKVQTILDRAGEKGYVIGRIISGERKVHYS